MRTSTLLGSPERTLGALVVVAWTIAIGVTMYRYRRGDLSRSGSHAWGAASLFWLAWGLLQLGSTFDDGTGRIIGLVGTGVGIAAIALVIRWSIVRRRGTPTTD